jgi:hypothetical protein
MPFSLKGVGSGLKKTFENERFQQSLAGLKDMQGTDIFSQIMAGLGRGADAAQKLRASQKKRAGGLPRMEDMSDVPLAGPPGGGIPPGVGDAGIPGAPVAGPAPSPDMVLPPPGVNSGDMSAGENMGMGNGSMEEMLKKALRAGQMGY